MQADPKLKLWFVGIVEDENYHFSLMADIEKTGLTNQIHYLGARGDVHELLAAADVYLMPSMSEAHSISFLEAMACGLPIIASNIPAFLFARGKEGIVLIDPNDQSAYQNAIRQFTEYKIRYNHDLSPYDIATTAKSYETLDIK
jgi:glycosyltransferase involved in cell wall biosynthesis